MAVSSNSAGHSFKDLVDIVERLRMPNGCPWDREQTHKSIRNGFIEEVYEAADAIDNNDNENLCEELGDVLLQVVFHSQIAREENSFTVDDVIDGICNKLIYRHPHVFGDTVAETSQEVLENWDKLKKVEKNQTTYTDTLKSVPMSYPSLMRAAKVQKRAAKAGFDWKNANGPLKKIAEETDELNRAIENDDKDNIFEEFGDLLFSIANLSRFLKIDGEQALNRATDKFIKRFEIVENLAEEKGIDMQSADPEELDMLWD